MRKYPDAVAYLRASVKGARDLLPGKKACRAFGAQGEELHPGKRDEDRRARNELKRTLQTEFNTLLTLIGDVNQTIYLATETSGLKAALELSTLQTIILQDAFGRTARKAALWVEGCQTAGVDEERQVMLDELAAYTHGAFTETAHDGIALSGHIRLQHPSLVEAWVGNVIVLTAEVFKHQAAAGIVQDRYFDGHPILYRDAEAKLEEVVKTITDGIGTFNEYLKTRAELPKAKWGLEGTEEGIAPTLPGERDECLGIDIRVIKSEAAGCQAAAMADQWIKSAKADTKRMEAESLGDRITIWKISQEMVAELPGGES